MHCFSLTSVLFLLPYQFPNNVNDGNGFPNIANLLKNKTSCFLIDYSCI